MSNPRIGFAVLSSVSAGASNGRVSATRREEYVHDRPGFVFEGRARPWLPTALPVALLPLGAPAAAVVLRIGKRHGAQG